MRWLWIIGLVLAAGAAVAGCERREPAGRRETGVQAGGPAGGDMSSMPGMAGMSGTAAGGDSSGVPIDRTRAGQLGITFARAAERQLDRRVRLTGTLVYAEPRREYVNARVNGWIEGLRADYVGRPVHQGEVLLSIYAPDLLSAQEEYLS